MKLQLSDTLVIGKGSRRVCFQNPQDPSTCIKITFNNHKRDENKREAHYLSAIQDLDRLPISLPIQWVNTNMGKGLTYPLIKDYSGDISKDIGYYDQHQIVDSQQLNADLEIFKNNLLTGDIPIRDLVGGNVVYQRLSAKSGRFILIDGIGKPKLFSPKSLIRKYIEKSYQRYFSHLFIPAHTA